MSIDLEDARIFAREGAQYPCRVEKNVEIFADFLNKNNWPCTFFVVGELFRRYPTMIKALSQRPGFEIAWHSENHQPVVTMTREEFRRDVMGAQELAATYGLSITGYRAPIFSVGPRAAWFHEELEQAQFTYSSSVLPAAHPLYGWPNFSKEPTKVGGILEIPMRLVNLGPLKVPLGGVYLRVLPLFLQRIGLFSLGGSSPQKAVPTYLHPYDYDFLQERYMHGGINESQFMNWLIFLNRRNMLARLQAVATWFQGDISNYCDYVRKMDA
jgi:polysaccharide deacetylase family protein (PEP-CTERM system associated)